MRKENKKSKDVLIINALTVLLTNIIMGYLLLKFGYFEIKMSYITILLIFSLQSIDKEFFSSLTVEDVYNKIFKK